MTEKHAGGISSARKRADESLGQPVLRQAAGGEVINFRGHGNSHFLLTVVGAFLTQQIWSSYYTPLFHTSEIRFAIISTHSLQADTHEPKDFLKTA